MPRTPAQIEAAERDGPYCLWHLYRPENSALVALTDVHHLARRQPGSDQADLCIGLCHYCHIERHHKGFSPTTAELLDIMQLVYGINLRRKYPKFFGGLD